MKMGFFAAMITMVAAPAALSQPMTPMSTVTLNVPLQISDYAGPVAQLWCELLDGADRSLPTWSDPGTGQQAALAFERVSITRGSFNGTKALSVRLPSASLPQVRGWRCILATNDGYRPDPRSLDLASYQALVPLAELRGRF